MAHNINLNEQFVFSDKLKKFCFTLIIVGLVAIGIDVIIHSMSGGHDAHSAAVEQVSASGHGVASADSSHAETGHHVAGYAERIMSNLLINSYYLVWMGLAGLFFIAIQYLSNAGWSVAVMRIPLAFSSILPLAGILVLAVIGIGLYSHTLYTHWADPELTIQFLADGSKNPRFDKIIDGKKALLNIPFFLARVVLFFSIWLVFQRLYKKYILNEDAEKEVGVKWFDKTQFMSAIYIPVFALSFCVAAFDWMMSLEPHWFSTMFAVYNFASMWVSGLAAITLVVIVLKENGYLSFVNDSHIHDLGKFVFAFSIFWTYIWLSQFLLIWYANLPEESVYFYNRWVPEYKTLFWVNLVINWIAPFLMLMSRDAKRNFKWLKIVCVIVICGHWLDLFLMVMPGTMGAKRELGFLELGTFFTFAGIFAYVMFNALSKHPLVAKKHPFLDESLHHEI